MKVRYEDGPDSLLIASEGINADRGEAVEVSAEVGAKLIEQGWTEVKTTAKKKESN